MDRFEELANAIVLQAVDDYRLALKQLRQKTDYQPAINMKHEVEMCGRSEWLTMLTQLDGAKLLARLNKEVVA